MTPHRPFHLGILIAALIPILAACGAANIQARFRSASSSVFDIDVDHQPPTYNAEFMAFFPDSMRVYAGDTLVFHSTFRGAPHTVILGTFVTEGLQHLEAAAEESAPGQGGAGGGYGPPGSVDDHSIPELAAIPDFFAPHYTSVNQSVAQPCFLDSGGPPGPGPTPCPRRRQPDFDGTQSFYSSGWLRNGQTFRVKLSPEIKPGTYAFMCGVHRSDMTGSFTVLSPIPNSRQDSVSNAQFGRALADRQLEGMVSSLQPSLDAANLERSQRVAAGVASPDVDGPLATVFAPNTVTIRAGTSVTWSLASVQDIAFNVPSYDNWDLREQTNGTVELNHDAWAPTGLGTMRPAPAGYGIEDLGTWDGAGFFNTGAITAPTKVKLTFTTPGRYQYSSLLYGQMRGVVNVLSSR